MDRLLVGPGPAGIETTGVPKHPRINPGTALANRNLLPVMPRSRRQVLETLSRDELWSLEALAGLPVYETSGGVDFAAGVAFCRELLER